MLQMSKHFVLSLLVILTALVAIIESDRESLRKWRKTVDHLIAPSRDQRVARIYGGENAQANEFPFMVLVTGVSQGPPIDVKLCGGTIIDITHILTAASCFYNNVTGEPLMPTYVFTVVVGVYDIDSITSSDDILDIKSISFHPKFNPTTKIYDAAIIELITPIQLSDRIKIACLSSDPKIPVGKEGMILGWGVGGTETSTPYTSILQKANVTNECESYCNALLGTFDSESMFCASQNSVGFCFGDNGGPILTFDGKNYVQYGIISHTAACGEPGKPGYYTKMASIKTWAQEIAGHCFECA